MMLVGPTRTGRLELGLESESELGDQREETRPVVAVEQNPSGLPEAAKPAYVAPQTSPSTPASWRESAPPRPSDTSPAARAPSPRPTRKLRAKPIAMSRTSGVRASPERLVEGRRIRRDRREDCGAVRLHIVLAGHAVILLANEGGGRYGGTRGRGQERRPHFFRPSDDAEIGVEGQNVLSCCPRARPPASTGPGRAGRAVRRMGTGRPESAVNRGTV